MADLDVSDPCFEDVRMDTALRSVCIAGDDAPAVKNSDEGSGDD